MVTVATFSVSPTATVIAGNDPDLINAYALSGPIPNARAATDTLTLTGSASTSSRVIPAEPEPARRTPEETDIGGHILLPRATWPEAYGGQGSATFATERSRHTRTTQPTRGTLIAFKGSTYKRCKCTGPKLDTHGNPLHDDTGTPLIRELGTNCPLLTRRDHGTWYYYISFPDGPRGERRRPRKGGFVTKAAAKAAAQKLWDEAEGGVDIDNQETVAAFLHRWHATRVDLKRGIREDYKDYIDRLFIPAFGHLKMRDLRTKDIQAMFEDIWALNEVKAANRIAAEEAEIEHEAARQAWRQAPKPRPPHLRQQWHDARAALKAARALPATTTAPDGRRSTSTSSP